jgi:hypothetical protein
VGSHHTSDNTDVGIIEHWDGTSWAVAVLQPTGVFFSVTCALQADCWAVGSQGADTQTFVERWNGTAWAIVTSPTPATGTGIVELHAVTCVSASDCWAVGFSESALGVNSTAQTLIERWDGTAWAIVTSPNSSPAQQNVLWGVSCVTADNCWAVGEANMYTTVVSTSLLPNGSAQTLIERWDGTAWALDASPNAGNADVPFGVTCVSALDCWMVGAYTFDFIQFLTLTDRYAALGPQVPEAPWTALLPLAAMAVLTRRRHINPTSIRNEERSSHV